MGEMSSRVVLLYQDHGTCGRQILNINFFAKGESNKTAFEIEKTIFKEEGFEVEDHGGFYVEDTFMDYDSFLENIDSESSKIIKEHYTEFDGKRKTEKLHKFRSKPLPILMILSNEQDLEIYLDLIEFREITGQSSLPSMPKLTQINLIRFPRGYNNY